MFYVESLDRARRKRQVSKEIKVAAEENDFDVKNGVLYRLMYLQIFPVIQCKWTIVTFYLVKTFNKFLDDTKDYPIMDRAVQEDNGSMRDEFEDFLGPDDDSLFLETSSERQTSSEER